jgi:hypothetical protein
MNEIATSMVEAMAVLPSVELVMSVSAEELHSNGCLRRHIAEYETAGCRILLRISEETAIIGQSFQLNSAAVIKK